MNRFMRLSWAAVAALLSAVVAHQALADPPDIFRDYRFITSRSTVHVSGGFAGFDMDLAIQGRFGLVTGYDYSVDPTGQIPTLVPHAEFVDVHAILFNPLSLAPMPVPGWDLDQTLNLTGLSGTFQIGDPTRLFFHGEDGQGQPIKLEATLQGRLLHIVGANDPGCCDFFHYKIDALAYLKPYPDWNLDDTIDAADYVLLRKAAGTPDEYGAWQEVFGANMADDGASAAAAPEPTTLMLLLIGALASPAIATFRAARRASA
ncbi:MAG: hypothetical protein L0228_07355 [Planctomycetes bacterium]|nr:hypothetical protein [Planctomycetota bacterium]